MKWSSHNYKSHGIVCKFGLLLIIGMVLSSCTKGAPSSPANGGKSSESIVTLSGDGSSALTLDFGDASLGAAEKVITVNNPTSDALTNLQITLSSDSFQFKGGQFPGVGGTCSGTLAANSSCTVVVMYVTALSLRRVTGGMQVLSIEAQLLIKFILKGIAKSNTVALHIGKANSIPVAMSQSVTLQEDSSKAVVLQGSDADGETLAYSVVAQPAHGTISGTVPNVTYTPNLHYSGNDSFAFKVNDGHTDSESATVSIVIGAINYAPVASPQSVIATTNVAKTITLGASDVENPTLAYSVVTQATHGLVTGTPPNVTYTPTTDYFGTDSFTFKANDGSLDSNTATISIVVNHLPIPNIPSTVYVSKDTAQPITLSASDPDGDNLTYSISTNPSHGTLTGTGASLTYTPAAGYLGSDAIGFKVSDGKTQSAEALISIAVVTVEGVSGSPAPNQPVTITIIGTGFVSGATVTVNGTNCSNVQILSTTQLTCELPNSSIALTNIVVTPASEAVHVSVSSTASSAVDITGNGNTWANLSNALTTDGALTSVTYFPGDISDSLRLTGYFANANANASIPQTAEIKGVKVNCSWMQNRSGTNTPTFRLVKNGATVGAVRTSGETISIGSVALSMDYGGDTDLWGVALSPADITSSGFGIELTFENTSTIGMRVLSIDSCKMSVSWGQPSNLFHTIFVTNQLYNGNLGGLAGADAKCAAQAVLGSKTSSLSGTWRAVLSSDVGNAKDRIALSQGYSIKNTKGETISLVATNLWNGNLSNAIQYSADGVAPINGPNLTAWSGSNADGNRIQIGSAQETTCSSWTDSSSSSDGVFGNVNVADSSWIYFDQDSCSLPKRLYCINSNN